MKLLAIILMTFIFLVAVSGDTYAENLLGEINDLIRLVSVQSVQMDRVVTAKSPPVANKVVYSSGIKSIIKEAAERYELSPLLIESIIKVESNYNPAAVSKKGAMGLMQLMPGTAREMGVTKPFDPYQNVIGGTYYYRLMFDRFGDHRKALWAYNCGSGCVEGGYMPLETRAYINNVARVYKDLKQKKGGNHVR
jgi:soluble lytic murein transglycosylase-like protein